jgi:putative flippase GtrA
VNTLIRWWKFNLVGAIGMGVQLGSLALLNRWMRGRYLYASALATELTLLHNFVWHMHYTWRDRVDRRSWLGPLLRFHLANGLISIVGNLVLMKLLVQGAHLRVLPANLLAILGCSLANFFVGHKWAFMSSGANGQFDPSNPVGTGQRLQGPVPSNCST